MLFNVEYDHGDVIEGYVIPDGFSEEASIVVMIDDGSSVLLPCDGSRPAVVQSGRHATGRIGFRIDSVSVPNLSNQKHLAIRDLRTGILIYRRPPVNNPVQKKVLRLELSMLPMHRFDKICGKQFQYEISSVERFGHETAMQAFHLNAVPSIYISGRLLLRNYEEFLDRGFLAIVRIPDPYYEMASRLYVMKRLAHGSLNFIDDRDKIHLSSASEYLSDLNLDDERKLKSAIKKAPEKVRDVLRSPFVRQLTCTYPEQSVGRREVAPAIDVLSRFAVVGMGEGNSHFQDAVGALVDLPGSQLPVASQHKILNDIALRLRQITAAEHLLEEDLIFYHYVQEASASVVK